MTQAPTPRIWLRPGLISPWIQIVAKLILLIGPGIIFGLTYDLAHRSGDFVGLINNQWLVKDAAIESAFLGLFLLILRARGWQPADLRIRIGWLSSLEGLGLLIVTYSGILLTGWLVLVLIHSLHGSPLAQSLSALIPRRTSIAPGSVHLSWSVILVFTLLNAFYEELIYMGYAFNQCAAKWGPWTALLLTGLLRLSVHSYQGAEHLVQIATLSLIFGLWYRWIGKVWPLILAHAVIDLVSLGALLTSSSH